jgi:hypothetical protein
MDGKPYSDCFSVSVHFFSSPSFCFEHESGFVCSNMDGVVT